MHAYIDHFVRDTLPEHELVSDYVIPCELSERHRSLVVSFTSSSSIYIQYTMGDIEEELGRIYHLVGELSGMFYLKEKISN
jgi:hypothetical protein